MAIGRDKIGDASPLIRKWQGVRSNNQQQGQRTWADVVFKRVQHASQRAPSEQSRGSRWEQRGYGRHVSRRRGGTQKEGRDGQEIMSLKRALAHEAAAGGRELAKLQI